MSTAAVFVPLWRMSGTEGSGDRVSPLAPIYRIDKILPIESRMTMNNDDDTQLLKTLDPDRLSQELGELTFDWRLPLAEDQKTLVEKRVADVIDRHEDLSAAARTAVVTREGIQAEDRTVRIDLFDESLKRLATVRILDDGEGALALRRD